MKNLTKNIAKIAIIASFGFAGFASAESTTGNAEVLILDTISFVEDQVVDFGTWTAGTYNCDMAANGVISGVDAECTGLNAGTPGQITVSGTDGQFVTVSVGSGSTDNNVTYTPKLASGNPSDSVQLLGGSTVVNVIGNLDLAAATGGARAMTYTLTVDYQ